MSTFIYTTVECVMTKKYNAKHVRNKTGAFDIFRPVVKRVHGQKESKNL